jgi:hypothetical protein
MEIVFKVRILKLLQHIKGVVYALRLHYLAELFHCFVITLRLKVQCKTFRFLRLYLVPRIKHLRGSFAMMQDALMRNRFARLIHAQLGKLAFLRFYLRTQVCEFFFRRRYRSRWSL